MTLLTMLIALIVERLAVRGSAWQLRTYLQPYLQRGQAVTLPGLPQHYLMLLWWLLPALLVSLLIYSVQFWLLQLVLNTLVLLLCIGSWSYRQSYKQFLNAAQRDDQEAVFLSMQQIRAAQGAPELSYGQQLIWLNFRYYAAVLFWYALLGAFGAVAYACLRQLSEPGVTQTEDLPNIAEDNPTSESAPAAAVTDEQWRRFADDLLHWADWLPVRLFGLGLALVGDFSRTSAVLLQHAGALQMSAPDLLAELSQAAEPVPEELLNTPDAAVSAVALAKRNVLFFLALIAILTLSGWLS
jgi:AmpE protein